MTLSKKEEIPSDPEGIQRSNSNCSQNEGTSQRIDDAVFGEVSEDGPNYRNVRATPWSIYQREQYA
jgi:hypothetical protein